MAELLSMDPANANLLANTLLRVDEITPGFLLSIPNFLGLSTRFMYASKFALPSCGLAIRAYEVYCSAEAEDPSMAVKAGLPYLMEAVCSAANLSHRYEEWFARTTVMETIFDERKSAKIDTNPVLRSIMLSMGDARTPYCRHAMKAGPPKRFNAFAVDLAEYMHKNAATVAQEVAATRRAQRLCANQLCASPLGARLLCVGCYSAWYCSPRCQSADFALHKHYCRTTDSHRCLNKWKRFLGSFSLP